jgi:hypothetical protein
MAAPALGVIASALSRAVPIAARGLLTTTRGLSRGLGNIARQNNRSPKGINPKNPAFNGINNSFQFLGKNVKSLQPLFQRLNKSFQFMAKSFRLLQLNSISSSSSINSLSASLIGMIPIIGKTAKKFVLFAEGIADTIVDTFTGIPNFIESKFSGIISLIKSYSPAQAKQIEIALGRLRATIGEALTPLAPMIKNIVLNVARFIKDNISKIDIKSLFKWIVFFMFLSVGVIIAGVKLIIKLAERINQLLDKPKLAKQRVNTIVGDFVETVKEKFENAKNWVRRQLGLEVEEEPPVYDGVSGEIFTAIRNMQADDLTPEELARLQQLPPEVVQAALQASTPRQDQQSVPTQATQATKSSAYTPEKMMADMSSFFRKMGMEDFSEVMKEMSSMFDKLFETPDTKGLPFEATTSTATSVEDIGKQAREAALGVNKKPEEETAEATKQTSRNTEDIRHGVQGLVGALPRKSVMELIREAELHIEAIRALDKNNMMALDADRQEQALVINGIEAMAKRQEKANELLMRMVDNQRLIAEMERSKNYSFGRLNNQRA